MARTLVLDDGVLGAIAELALRDWLWREMVAGRLVVCSVVGPPREFVALQRSESGRAGVVIARWQE